MDPLSSSWTMSHDRRYSSSQEYPLLDPLPAASAVVVDPVASISSSTLEIPRDFCCCRRLEGTTISSSSSSWLTVLFVEEALCGCDMVYVSMMAGQVWVIICKTGQTLSMQYAVLKSEKHWGPTRLERQQLFKVKKCTLSIGVNQQCQFFILNSCAFSTACKE